MRREPHNVGAMVRGAAPIVETNRLDEMEALDLLPTEVRRAICEARFQISSKGLAEMAAVYGVAAVVRAVKATDDQIAAHAALERGL